MKTLIVYYSFTGNNALFATELKERLRADLYEIKEVKQRTVFTILCDMLFNRKARIELCMVATDQYDRVILLGPVWNAKIATPLRSFIQAEKAHLNDYGLVTVCGGRSGQQEKLEQQLTKLAGRPPLFVQQLSLDLLLPPERKREARNGASFKLEKQDLKFFDPGLKWIEDLPESGSSEVNK